MKRPYRDISIGVIALMAFFLLLLENTFLGESYRAVFRWANLMVFVLFAGDVLLRFGASERKWDYVKRKWFDLIVFVPLIQYVPAVQSDSLFVVIRQVVIVVMLISRSRRARRLATLLSLEPGQAMVAGFLGAVGIGSVLLMLPLSTTVDHRCSLADAVFTATSAVCVTGLSVQDTATYFSRFGQMVILTLIQAGGLGIMTFSVALVVFRRKQMDVRQRAALQDALDYDALAGVIRLVRFIVLMTLLFEAAGAIGLMWAWRGRFSSGAQTVYHAVFHSVSAFCNAGFSTFSDSLMSFRADTRTNVVICCLIVAGGLGFMVILDVLTAFRARLTGQRVWHKVRVQTKVVLWVTTVLIVGGSVLIYAAEEPNFLRVRPERGAVLSAVFQSVSARTAGFNTVDMGKLSATTLLITMVLMFIGASPGSTAGGIKTTTLAVLWASVRNSLRNRPHIELWRRTIPPEAVQKALMVLCLSLLLVCVFAGVLLHVEKKPFVDCLFETVSAFGTAGLSTGMTPQLSVVGKLLITVLMFVGRLGPLTMAYALVGKRQVARYKYAEERLMIG
ncbi:TrkH family potassium uptake protein [Planctomycetota bacterium]